MNERDVTERVARLLESLRGDAGRRLPTTALGRLSGTARIALRTGTSVLAGVIRGRGESGLGRADIEAIERLVASLGELKGVAMKVGQIWSYIDPAMPPETRELLALLQTQSQPTAFDAITTILREELGERADELLADIERAPVAVASIGQVHRGRLPDGTRVAIKVRHPGIEDAIAADFKAAGVGRMFATMLGPAGSAAMAGEWIDEARTRLLEECDYNLEASRQMAFGRLLAGHPTLIVPAVHEAWSARRVLTTTWEEGLDMEAYLAAGPTLEERSLAGRALFELYIGALYKHGLFHADPHPGNYLFRADGRVVVFDYGCVREFDEATVAAVASLVRAVRADDAEAMRSALSDLGAEPGARPADFALVRELLRGFLRPLLEDGPRPVDARISMVMSEIMRDKMAMLRIRLPAKLMFLFRLRFGLYAVLARLGAVCDWAAMESELADAALVRCSHAP